MLRSLYIKNYLLVNELRLNFSSGLTVLTGETGAGKSMIVGALDVLLGEKLPKDAVGDFADKTVIEGIFALPSRKLMANLIDPEDSPDEIILRREFARQGRARSYLNDRPITQDLVAGIRHVLVDFHGQREQNSLFEKARQIGYVDAFAKTGELAAQVRELVTERSARNRELHRLQSEIAAQTKERALLAYQLEEIERLGLKPGEEVEIEARLRKLESAEKLASECGYLLELLSEGDPSLIKFAGQAKAAAQAVAKTDQVFDPFAQELGDIGSRLKDIAGSIRDYADDLSVDEAELATLRDRRGILWNLKRKHGVSVEQILARADELKALLRHGEELERELESRQLEIDLLDRRLEEIAISLSSKRSEATKPLSQRILKELHLLGFTNPQFEISFERIVDPVTGDKVTELGVDAIDFMFSANPGSKPAPVAQVASGGETSRVTLAIKSVLAHVMSYPLLVYDEIDLGISGKIADSVGKALTNLAGEHQVLAITHLPQIAAQADHHLSVMKSADAFRSETTAVFLNRRERVDAIASLIAGVNVTEKARASASELLRASGKLQAA